VTKMTPEQRAARAEERKHARIAEKTATAEARAAFHAAKEARQEGLYLTYEEYAAGAPCRKCGLPWKDTRGRPPPTEEESRAKKSEFMRLHPECELLLTGGDGAVHCIQCCPPPPLSPGQIAELRRLFAHAATPASRDLTRWAWDLRCGHTVESTQHRSNPAPNVEGWGTGKVRWCPTCEAHRGALAVQQLPGDAVPEAAPAAAPTRRRTEPRALVAARAKVAKQEAALREAEAALAVLTATEERRG